MEDCNTREVPLSQGYVALVDAADYERVAAHSWRYVLTGYAAGRVEGANVFMHRWIVDAPDGVEVDHRDRNRLDNRRRNLRFATRSQNAANCGKRGVASASRFKGVAWRKDRECWSASIMLNVRGISLGNYDSERDAAKAYDAAALQYFGEFAVLNLPEELEPLEQVQARRRKPKSSGSRYRGVYRYSQAGLFWASISVKSKSIHLGYHATEEAAALAYDAAARELHGAKAYQNFPS